MHWPSKLDTEDHQLLHYILHKPILNYNFLCALEACPKNMVLSNLQ